MKQLFRTYYSETRNGNEISINDFLESNSGWEIQLISSTHPFAGYVHVVFRNTAVSKEII